MGQGKYSPVCPHANTNYDYHFNAKGEIPPSYDHKVDTWNEEIHFGDYDSDGYDRYGYSAYDANKRFVGTGNGIDRLGNTEMDYMSMSAEEFMYL